MGYVAIILLITVLGLSAYVLVHPSFYSSFVLGSAVSALFVDVLGLIIIVWKVVFK